MTEPSRADVEFLDLLRKHVAGFRRRVASRLQGKRVLEIGPEHEVWPGADTLGLGAGCTYVADITTRTPAPAATYDAVLCMEVLEHVVDPFAAVEEIKRLMRGGGVLLASAPWNFRIHGPVPDLWRFNQNSWRVLLRDFVIEEMDVLDTPGRPLMPLHINVLARLEPGRRIDPRAVGFETIDR